jgi:hypothetical protein
VIPTGCCCRWDATEAQAGMQPLTRGLIVVRQGKGKKDRDVPIGRTRGGVA